MSEESGMSGARAVSPMCAYLCAYLCEHDPEFAGKIANMELYDGAVYICKHVGIRPVEGTGSIAYSEARMMSALVKKYEPSGDDLKELELHVALGNLLDRYTGLVNSGDCGNLDTETEDCVIEARKALGDKP